MTKPAVPSPSTLKPVRTSDGRTHDLAQKDIDRIWSKISINDQGCWVWTGPRLPSGYGRTSLYSSWIYLHRLMHMAFIGDIPDGWHTDHLCRNTSCCNPQHLEAVTCRENVRRSPIAGAAINARKTKCKRGHDLSGDNLYINADGSRVCRTCRRLKYLKRYAEQTGKPFDPSTVDGPGARYIRHARRSPSGSDYECARGHLLDEANTYVDPRGRTRCRACAREDRISWYRRSKGQSA